MRDTSPATRTDPLRELNGVGDAAARATFLELTGSARWAQAMERRRPFATADDVLAAADAAFDELDPADWREMFAAHAPIGAPDPGDARGVGEQSGIATDGTAQAARLAELNERYRARFGYVFLIRARGRDIDDVLDALARRIDNDPATELEVAAGQQREITQLRLAELLGE